MHNPFKNIPIEVLMEIFSYLAVEDLSAAASVNREFNRLSDDKNLWKRKFFLHFPHIFKIMNLSYAYNWYAHFIKTYQDEYKNLSNANKKLFSLVKESDITALDTLDRNHCQLTDEQGLTLLYWAVQKNNQALLNCFYKQVFPEYSRDLLPNVVKKDRGGWTILYWAIACNQPLEHINDLILQGAKIRFRNQTSLFVAAQYGHIEIVQELLAKKPNVNVACIDGRTPLYVAAENGHLEVVQALLAKKARVNSVCTDGTTPLFIAAENGHLEVVQALLAKKAGVNVCADGTTPLHIAAEYGHLEIAQALLAQHAAVKTTRDDGRTPLDVAIYYGHSKIVNEINKVRLKDYSDKTLLRNDDHYSTCFTFFNHTFNFGFSAGEKKQAAAALEAVILGKADNSCLLVHKDALNNGELGNIYKSFKF